MSGPCVQSLGYFAMASAGVDWGRDASMVIGRSATDRCERYQNSSVESGVAESLQWHQCVNDGHLVVTRRGPKLHSRACFIAEETTIMRIVL